MPGCGGAGTVKAGTAVGGSEHRSRNRKWILGKSAHTFPRKRFCISDNSLRMLILQVTRSLRYKSHPLQAEIRKNQISCHTQRGGKLERSLWARDGEKVSWPWKMGWDLTWDFFYFRRRQSKLRHAMVSLGEKNGVCFVRYCEFVYFKMLVMAFEKNVWVCLTKKLVWVKLPLELNITYAHGS